MDAERTSLRRRRLLTPANKTNVPSTLAQSSLLAPSWNVNPGFLSSICAWIGFMAIPFMDYGDDMVRLSHARSHRGDAPGFRASLPGEVTP